jgi:hypothetical protein
VVAVSIPSAYACYTIAFNAVGEIIVLKSFALLEQELIVCLVFTAHEDTHWYKGTKSKGVAGYYESKYPGTTSSSHAGPRQH